LKYANLPEDAQREAFLEIIWADPLVRTVLERARDFDLPDWWLVSGLLYNSVWNHLTGKPSGYGVNDADLFYFDDADLSYEAEDAVIQRGKTAFKNVSVPVEIRNQARVHLWFEQRFGAAYPMLRSGSDAIRLFASKTHSVGVRLAPDDNLLLHAPFGLNDIFTFRIAPNHTLGNSATHHAKAERQLKLWPELTFVPW
jgi:uncharacterized protein